MVPFSQPWGDFEVPDGVPWKRSAFKEVTSGKTRYEVASSWCNDQPAVLVLSGDEAATNLSAYHMLSGGAHIRCVFLQDGARRCWNDAKLALQDSDMWRYVLETLQVMQTKHAPGRVVLGFGSCKRFQKGICQTLVPGTFCFCSCTRSWQRTTRDRLVSLWAAAPMRKKFRVC